MTPRVAGWGWLAATVALEIAATLALRASNGFSEPLWSAAAIASYAATVLALAFALARLPMSVAYVVWTGAGTAGVAILGAIIFADRLGPLAWAGVALVVLGVAMINARRRAPALENGRRAPEEHPE